MLSFIGKSLDDYIYNKPVIARYLYTLGLNPQVMYDYDDYTILSTLDDNDYSMIIDGDNLVGIFRGKLDELDLNDLYHKYATGNLPYPLQEFSLKDIETAYATVSIDESYDTNNEQIIAISSYFELINKLTIAYLEQLRRTGKYEDYYTYIKDILGNIAMTIENDLLFNEEITIERLIADHNLPSSAYSDLMYIANGFTAELYDSKSSFDVAVKQLIK